MNLNLPGKPVAYYYGLLSVNYGLPWRIVMLGGSWELVTTNYIEPGLVT